MEHAKKAKIHPINTRWQYRNTLATKQIEYYFLVVTNLKTGKIETIYQSPKLDPVNEEEIMDSAANIRSLLKRKFGYFDAAKDPSHDIYFGTGKRVGEVLHGPYPEFPKIHGIEDAEVKPIPLITKNLNT